MYMYIFSADEQCTIASSGNATLRIDAPEMLMYVGMFNYRIK